MPQSDSGDQNSALGEPGRRVLKKWDAKKKER